MTSRSKPKKERQPKPRSVKRELLVIGLIAAIGAAIPTALRTLFPPPVARAPSDLGYPLTCRSSRVTCASIEYT